MSVSDADSGIDRAAAKAASHERKAPRACAVTHHTCLQRRKEDVEAAEAAARKLRELAKTPMTMVLTRVAQIIGGFADIPAQIAGLQMVIDAAGGSGRSSSIYSATGPSPDALHKALSVVDRTRCRAIF
jgi:hypothetical protein